MKSRCRLGSVAAPGRDKSGPRTMASKLAETAEPLMLPPELPNVAPGPPLEPPLLPPGPPELPPPSPLEPLLTWLLSTLDGPGPPPLEPPPLGPGPPPEPPLPPGPGPPPEPPPGLPPPEPLLPPPLEVPPPPGPGPPKADILTVCTVTARIKAIPMGIFANWCILCSNIV